MRARRAMYSLQFCNGVVVRLAFPVPQPGEETHGHNDNADADTKLCAPLHSSGPKTGSMAEMHSITRKSQPQIDFGARATRSKTCPAALASGRGLACQRLAQAACGLSSRIYLHHKGFSLIEQNRARQIA